MCRRKPLIDLLLLLPLVTSSSLISHHVPYRLGSITSSHLFARADDLKCPADDYTACGGDLPGNFCCQKNQTCITLAGDTTALCCPNSDCPKIATIPCNLTSQDVDKNPKAQILTTALDAELPACGDSCCPFGYSCGKCDINGARSDCCIQDSDQSKKPSGSSATTATPSSSSSPSSTKTLKKSSKTSTSSSSTSKKTASEETSKTAKTSTSASSTVTSGTETGTGGDTGDSDSNGDGGDGGGGGPSGVVLGSVFGSLAGAAAIGLGIFVFLRRRRAAEMDDSNPDFSYGNKRNDGPTDNYYPQQHDADPRRAAAGPDPNGEYGQSYVEEDGGEGGGQYEYAGDGSDGRYPGGSYDNVPAQYQGPEAVGAVHRGHPSRSPHPSVAQEYAQYDDEYEQQSQHGQQQQQQQQLYDGQQFEPEFLGPAMAASEPRYPSSSANRVGRASAVPGGWGSGWATSPKPESAGRGSQIGLGRSALPMLRVSPPADLPSPAPVRTTNTPMRPVTPTPVKMAGAVPTSAAAAGRPLPGGDAAVGGNTNPWTPMGAPQPGPTPPMKGFVPYRKGSLY